MDRPFVICVRDYKWALYEIISYEDGETAIVRGHEYSDHDIDFAHTRWSWDRDQWDVRPTDQFLNIDENDSIHSRHDTLAEAEAALEPIRTALVHAKNRVALAKARYEAEHKKAMQTFDVLVELSRQKDV